MYLLFITRNVSQMQQIMDIFRKREKELKREKDLKSGLVAKRLTAIQGVEDANPDVIIINASTPHSPKILEAIRPLTKAIVIVISGNGEDVIRWKMIGADQCLQLFSADKDGPRLLEAYDDSKEERRAGFTTERLA